MSETQGEGPSRRPMFLMLSVWRPGVWEYVDPNEFKEYLNRGWVCVDRRTKRLTPFGLYTRPEALHAWRVWLKQIEREEVSEHERA